MPWNSRADDLEAVIDFDGDGSLEEEKKPQTRKYPNAPAVIELFTEVLGLNETFWNKTPAILGACERLYTERGLTKVRNALEFYKEHKEEKYCPKITSPKKLEEKYIELSRYKNSLWIYKT